MGGRTRLRLGLGASLFVCCAVAVAQNAMTTDSADLYAGPDDAYPVVAELDSNTPIQVMGCLDDWSWCDVAVGDSRGWLYSPDITYRYEGGYVPFYSYAPSLGIAVVPFSVDLYWGRHYHDRPWYSRREEWAHRSVEHRRPPGPPPSAGPPPRPEHREGPREAARPDDRSLRLGSAEPRHEAPRPEEYGHPPDTRRQESRPSEPRPQPRPEPRPEQHAAPAPMPSPSHDDRARAAPHGGSPPAHEERPHSAGPSRPEEPPGHEHEDHQH
jgi:uncharacterized protein YraI